MRIHSRKSWHARQPKARTPQSDGSIREFFLHHPADPHHLQDIDTNQEQGAYMRAIQNFHMDTRGWSDFAYAFAVFQDGEVYRGRGRGFVPAAQLNHNTGTIAVLCVLGDGEKPTQKMKDGIARLKDTMDRRVGRDLIARPHSAVFNTSCPGDELRALIPRLNKQH